MSTPKSKTADTADAFLPDLVRRGAHSDVRPISRYVDDDADALAEEFLLSATSAEDAFEPARDELVLEELGGPFLDEVVVEAEGDNWIALRTPR